jgi:hypothetical protein
MAVARKHSATAAEAAASTPEAKPIDQGHRASSFAEWIAGAIEQGVKPEQALAVVGLGLMRGMSNGEFELPLLDNGPDADGDGAELVRLKERLDAIALAIKTGAPLTTGEVALLLGARPGSAVVRRAGVVAERISRNVWQLSRSSSDERSAVTPMFNEGFRRRL